MSRPAPFEDSFSTSDATISVAVARPHGERDEAVIITIDCTGSVSLDEGATDLVLEMIEGARTNLGLRRQHGQRSRRARRRRAR